MQHRIKTRFSIRLAGYARDSCAVNGDDRGRVRSGDRPGGAAPADLAAAPVQPYVHQEDADKRDTANQGVYAPDAQTLRAGLRGLERALGSWPCAYSLSRLPITQLDTSGQTVPPGGEPVPSGTSRDRPPARNRSNGSTIPSDVSLSIPILTTAFGAGLADCLSPGWGNAGPCDVNALRAAAAAEEDNPKTLDLSLDGIPAVGPECISSPVARVHTTLTSSNIVA